MRERVCCKTSLTDLDDVSELIDILRKGVSEKQKAVRLKAFCSYYVSNFLHPAVLTLIQLQQTLNRMTGKGLTACLSLYCLFLVISCIVLVLFSYLTYNPADPHSVSFTS